MRALFRTYSNTFFGIPFCVLYTAVTSHFSVVLVHPFFYYVCRVCVCFFFFSVQVVIDDAQFLDKDSWTLALAVATGEHTKTTI